MALVVISLLEYMLCEKGIDVMEGNRIEIRTPKENLLMFALVEKNGQCLVEVKSRSKIDFVEPNLIIQSLLNYSNEIRTK